MKLIHTDKAPSAIGPYSQATDANNFLFISGQLPVNPKTNKLVENDIVKQTRQVLENITTILQSQGLDINNIVKNTIFVKDMKQFPTVNEEYGKYFEAFKPARSTVEVSCLPKDALIEIECIVAK